MVVGVQVVSLDVDGEASWRWSVGEMKRQGGKRYLYSYSSAQER